MIKGLFEKIINREIPADIIYEDEHTLAFLDIHPLNLGHTLVVPKKHYSNIYDADSLTLHHIIDTVKRIAPIVTKVVGAKGFNVHVNNEEVAGQAIDYLHFHIIPRFEGDGFNQWQGNISQNQQEREKLAKSIFEELQLQAMSPSQENQA